MAAGLHLLQLYFPNRIKVDFMAYDAGSGFQNDIKKTGYSGSATGNIITYMFGPQIKKHSGTFQPFGEALFGAAPHQRLCHDFQVPGLINGSGDNNGFAMEFGGGLDIPVGENDSDPSRGGGLSGNALWLESLQELLGVAKHFKYVAGVNFTFGGK